MQNEFFERVGRILEQARSNAKTAINLSMVYAYYEIGKNIIEEEQNGKERADYGKYILKGLSDYMTENYGKGFSVDNLKLMRKFYNVYSKDMIGETVFPQFKNLPSTETELEKHIIDNLQQFLLELGKGFTFVGRQVRLTFEEEHFRCDLVFYNRLLKCFVLFDLKIGELKHQDIGQMQMYVNYYDRKVKLPDENNTIGVILCKDKNNAIVEMTLPEDNTQIFASKYQTVLPSKEELQSLLNATD